MVLDTIKGPEDVKRLSEEERKELAGGNPRVSDRDDKPDRRSFGVQFRRGGTDDCNVLRAESSEG